MGRWRWWSGWGVHVQVEATGDVENISFLLHGGHAPWVPVTGNPNPPADRPCSHIGSCCSQISVPHWGVCLRLNTAREPSAQEPLLMFPPHMPMAQQHRLPKSFQKLVRDKDGERIEGPQPKYMSAEDWYVSQPITIQVQMGAQQIVTLPGVQIAPGAPSLPAQVVRVLEVIAELEEDPQRRQGRRSRFNDSTTRGMTREQAMALHSDHLCRCRARGETSSTEFDSWSTDKEIAELDDLDELDMDTDENSEDERVVIPPRSRQVKVQLNAQGRQVAFSVSSPLHQPTLEQQQTAAILPVTSVPFTFVPAIPTITNPYPAVTIGPVPHVFLTMGMSWAQQTALSSQQLLPQPTPVLTTQVQPPITQAQVPPLLTMAPIFTYNVTDHQAGWTAGTGGAVGSALLPPTLPICSHEARRQFDQNQVMQAHMRNQRSGGQVRDQMSAAANWVYPAADQRGTDVGIGMPHGLSTPFTPRARGGRGRGRGGHESYSGKGRQWMSRRGRCGY